MKYVLDLHNRTISLHQVEVKLTGKDFDLAALFLLNVRRLMSRGYIAQTIWGQEAGSIYRTMNTHMSRLRRALSKSSPWLASKFSIWSWLSTGEMRAIDLQGARS